MKEPQVKKETYIPIRYIIAIILAVLETVTIVAIVFALCYYVPYFYLMVWATEIACVVRIIASEDNPDYKIPWLLVVLIIPVAGFMLYFLFYSRHLKKKFIKRLDAMKHLAPETDDSAAREKLKADSPAAGSQAQMLCSIADTKLYGATSQEYFPLGEMMHKRLLEDLKTAEKFIFMEYFIVEEGVFWDSILDILKEKAASGVEVKVIYDDIGCMMTLPGDYYKTLRSCGIEATPFSMLKGNADSEFNNRSHRKITVIDGRVGYTGGVNLADEYINEVVKFGHWKDTAIRLEGEAVRELTRLFLIDFGLNQWKQLEPKQNYFPTHSVSAEGFVIPFGDGPGPIYDRDVGKSVIQNMLNQANRYVWMMSPYLIVDNELRQAIEDAALRGVDVRIVLPHVPDKKLVLEMARSHYERLVRAGVKIYEYEPGFVHAKTYLADDEIAMVGTINLDYRSLVHNFENGVWMYRCDCLKEIKSDFEDLFDKCIPMRGSLIRWNLVQQFIRAIVKVFAPMM